MAGAARAQEAATFAVDFSRWSADPPLVKTKFGVYQTPLIGRAALLRSLALLREINVQDFRYELGWGKSDVLEPHQVAGTAAAPRLDFSLTNALVSGLGAQNVRPLFALTYCPAPLQTRSDWPAWKDLPRDLTAWQTICRAFAAHFRNARPKPAYEVWNEPDMPEPNGKMFFSGGPADYDRLYEHAAAGVRAGDANAPVGGAAIAYDLSYFQPLLLAARPLDFASIHAYDNYAPQIAGLRARLENRPDVPIYLTEYASFTMFGKSAPVSRHPAAARFFRDVAGMLALPDLAKVYWAQWVDDDLGLVTRDGHKKALFNAFKIYGQLPVDRNAVTPAATAFVGVNALASSDEHNAGVVAWNESEQDRVVTLRLRRLPFARGGVQVFRIDKNHASYGDDPAAENLTAERQWTFSSGAETNWTGIVPAQSVVYLKLADRSGRSLLAPTRIGTLTRTHYWFGDRKTNAYADFDARTGIARLGAGTQNAGVAQIGAALENPVRRFTVRVKRTGPFAAEGPNSLFGLRLDFGSRGASGGYAARSVLFHGGLYDARRDAVLPWGRGGAAPGAARKEAGMNTGKPFVIDLDKIAPPDWDGRRVLVSFILQNAGAGSRARIALTPDAAGDQKAIKTAMSRPGNWARPFRNVNSTRKQ